MHFMNSFILFQAKPENKFAYRSFTTAVAGCKRVSGHSQAFSQSCCSTPHAEPAQQGKTRGSFDVIHSGNGKALPGLECNQSMAPESSHPEPGLMKPRGLWECFARGSGMFCGFQDPLAGHVKMKISEMDQKRKNREKIELHDALPHRILELVLSNSFFRERSFARPSLIVFHDQWSFTKRYLSSS